MTVIAQKVTIDAPSSMNAGESLSLDVIIPLAGPAQTPVGEGRERYVATPVGTRLGNDFYLVFAPSAPTTFTLKVDAPGFEPPAELPQASQRNAGDTEAIDWTIGLKAKPGTVGEQTIILTVMQSIDGILIEAKYQSQELPNVTLTVNAPGGSAAVSTGGFASLAIWMLPAIIIPLLPVIVALVGRENILGWYRRRFRRKRRKNDDEVIP